jgi:uncharacterized protein (TIGR03435 family)
MKNVLTAALVVFLAGLASGQDKTAAPAFEVAAIKPNASNDHRMSIQMGGGGEIIMSNFTLRRLIMFAYDVKGYSLSGPDFMDTVSFDVNAKPPANSARDQIKPMMQALLAERFKLQIHRETKTLTGYALLIAKGGLKIKQVQASDGPDGGGQQMRMGIGQLTAQKIDMKALADLLANQMDRPVVDMTYLKGLYDIKLEYTPEQRGGMNPAPEGVERPAPDAAGPSIYTALQEQLGLRVESQKVPVEVVIVDKVEKVPTEN